MDNINNREPSKISNDQISSLLEDFSSIDLKVGFEIHQQLATKNKLFCKCNCIEEEKYDNDPFSRRLRPTQSELGSYDPASLFEHKKMKLIKYSSSKSSSCLIEADEEPPIEINNDAIETALIFSLALKSFIFDEIHVMRKIVIDGSNTTGFQRTMLISTGGYIEVLGKHIGVQSICLEEDASKLLNDSGVIREYGLDRLGIPLIEIALEPISGNIDNIVQTAVTLGRLLRVSKRVVRGLGSIRQDVNVSINNGSVVEVKGVQQIDQLSKVIRYEAIRQHGLTIIAEKLNERNRMGEKIAIGDKIKDITELMKESSSKIIKKIFTAEANNNNNNNCTFKVLRVKGFGGLIGFEPYPEIRLGKQLGELVRFYGLGGVFHSDELPNYGISFDDVSKIRQCLDMDDNNKNDAFIIVGGPTDKINFAIDAIIERLYYSLKGVPAETRTATQDGKTIFIRPRPGPARMYPETDIPIFRVSNLTLESLANKIPRSWDETIHSIATNYQLNLQQATQIFDSDYFDLFEKIKEKCKKISSSFIVSKLTEDIVNLERQGLSTKVLTDDIFMDLFQRLEIGTIAKESIPLILEKLMKKDADNIDHAIKLLDLKSINDQELNNILDQVIQENISIVNSKGINSLSALMGKSMSVLRGKVDGKKINELLRVKLESMLYK